MRLEGYPEGQRFKLELMPVCFNGPSHFHRSQQTKLQCSNGTGHSGHSGQCMRIICSQRIAVIGGRARRVGRSSPIKGVCMDWYSEGYMKGGVQRGVHEQRGPRERYMKGGTGWLHTLLTPQSPRHPSLLLEKLWKIAQTSFLLEFKNFFWVQELFINVFFDCAL